MTTIYTTGVFDILHRGHLNILVQAKSLGEKLIVGVQEDESVFNQKGRYPVLTTSERVAMLKSLPFIDDVISYSSLDQRPVLKKIKPNIVVQGGDWLSTGNRKTILSYLKKNNIDLVLVPYTQGISSTEIKRRLLRTANLSRRDFDHLMSHINLLSISKLSCYEKYDEAKVGKLVGRLRSSKFFIDPIVVGKWKNKKIVIDGANRLEALRRVGGRYVVANVVDYSDINQVELLSNVHNVKISMKDMAPLIRGKKLTAHKDKQEDALIDLVNGLVDAVITNGNEAYSIGNRKNLKNSIKGVNKIVDIYLKDYSFTRLSEFSATTDSRGVKIYFRKFTPDDIVSLVNDNLYLNSGVTWHQVKQSIIRLRIPLNILITNDNQKKATETFLSLIKNKIALGHVRYFPSQVYICDEWE